MFLNVEDFGRNLRIFCGVMGASLGLCTDPYCVKAAPSGLANDSKSLSRDASEAVTLTVQRVQLLGTTNKEVAGASIALPHTEVFEYHGYLRTDGEKVVFLRKGDNITYLAKAIYSKDKGTGQTHIDLVPGTIEAGILGTSTATSLPNGGVKIDVTVSDIKLVDMPNCSDVQCPVTVERQSGRTVTLFPDQAETVDLPLWDNHGQSIRLIFSRQKPADRTERTTARPAVNRT